MLPFFSLKVSIFQTPDFSLSRAGHFDDPGCGSYRKWKRFQFPEHESELSRVIHEHSPG